MKKKYKSLMEFAIFGKDDEVIDLRTLKVTKKINKNNKKKKVVKNI